MKDHSTGPEQEGKVLACGSCWSAYRKAKGSGIPAYRKHAPVAEEGGPEGSRQWQVAF